jgi:hypothetical protein
VLFVECSFVSVMLAPLVEQKRFVSNLNSSKDTHTPLALFTHAICTSGGRCRLRLGRMIICLGAWPYFYCSILDDCHSYSIRPAQYTFDRFRLLHDTTYFPILITRLLQTSLGIKVYNVGAQIERKFGIVKVTDSDTFNTA